MYADSGATNSYFRLADVKCYHTQTKNPVPLQHAGEVIVVSTHTTTLHLPTCIKNKIEGRVLSDLKSVSLLSIWQFCDNGCSVFYNKNKVYVIHNTTIILQGHHNTSNGVCIIPVPIKSSTATTHKKI